MYTATPYTMLLYNVRYFDFRSGMLHTRNDMTLDELLKWEHEGTPVLTPEDRDTFSKRGGILGHIAYKRDSDGEMRNRASWRTQEKYKHLRVEAFPYRPR